MYITKSNIIAKVRMLLNEIGLNDSEFEGGSDEQDLNTMIGDLAVDALRFVHGNAVAELLEADGYVFPDQLVATKGVIADAGWAYVDNVSDYFRFVRAHCSDWKKPLLEALNEGTPAWDKLYNPLLTATVDNPKASIGKSHTATSEPPYVGTRITLHGIPPTGNINAYILYIKEPKFEVTENIWVSRLLQDAFYYYLVYLVLMALGDARAATALQQALPLMGLKNTGND